MTKPVPVDLTNALPADLSERETRYAAAYAQATGEPIQGASWSATLAIGVSQDLLTAVAARADAIAGDGPARAVVGGNMTFAVTQVIAPGMGVEEAMRWASLVEHAEDEAGRRAMFTISDLADTSELAQWREPLPGQADAPEWGPLAWAAGLSVEEARSRAVAGTLDLAGLRTLAVLRGFTASP